MAGFLDTGIESDFSGLPNNHGVQTLDFIKKVLKGIRYASLSVATRTVTGQIKNGDGSNHAAAVSINIQCDQVLTVNTGTLVTTGNSSIQVTTNASGIFQVTVAGSQGATAMVTVDGGVTTTVLVGSGGTGGGGGGGGSSGVTLKDEGSTVTGGPHTAVNFVGSGVSVADAGGGQATVTVSGGGGGPALWTPGSYSAGQMVMRGPYIWTATTTTSEDPMLVEGNLGSIADWVPQTAGSPGMVQTPGPSDGAPDGKILLINNALGSGVTAYRQSVNSGFLGKMLVVDVQISGTADWLYFGVFDSTAVQTAADLLAVPGNTFYGVNIFIYTPSTAKIENIINGAIGTNVGYSNANSTNAGSAFSRWYLKMIQNGSNWDLELLRDARVVGASPYSGFDPEQVDSLVPIARFTNVARPSYTNWRFVVGARTGGAAGIFSCRAAYVRNITSGHWRALGKLPTQI